MKKTALILCATLALSACQKDDTNEQEYEYTGKVKSTKVTLYDYKSDKELQPTNNGPEYLYTNYGCEPFNQFNTKISDDVADSVTQQDMNKIIITYKPDSSRNTSNGVKIYLWKDSPRDVGHQVEL